MTVARTMILAASLVALAPLVHAAPQGAPRAVVEQFHDALLGVMKDAKSLGFEGRRSKLAPAVERSFDLTYMAQVATGSAWSNMQPQQQDELVELFRRMTVSTYASRFTGYSGQQFEIVGIQETPRGDVLVRANLTNGSEQIPIDYLMRKVDDNWKIADIYFKRISELATRRSEYSSVIQRNGVDALLQTLEAKVKQIEAGRNS
ncbi:MAG: ABC transporter substrate-binding protein [Alphaproteobacteria bacterium]